jgi:hypothetical protein
VEEKDLMSLESHAHRLSKQLLVKWLRDAASIAEYPGLDGGNFGGIRWRHNRGAPYWGVWEEYPFLSTEHPDYCVVWDELGYAVPPSYNELTAAFTPPTAIADIALQHKGLIIHAIEIVHKNHITAEKIKILRNYIPPGGGIIEIPTHWILGQVSIPKIVPEEFFLTF